MIMNTLGFIIEVVLRPQDAKGFVLLPKRWVVEHAFGWFNHWRQLSKDYMKFFQKPLRHLSMLV